MAELLIVEDEKHFREDLALFFRRKHGWTVYEAGGPDEAIRLISDLKPKIKLDAIIVDRRMPRNGKLDDGAGDAVMRWLYDQHMLADLCAVMLTAYGELDSASLALSMGAWQYLQKPLEPLEIYRYVAPGIALKKCHRLRREVANQRGAGSILERVQQIVKETLAPDTFHVLLEREGKCVDLMTGQEINPDRRFVREIREGKTFIYASTRAEVRQYQPVLPDAGKLMAVRVVINQNDTHGVVWMESQQEGAFDPRWQEVLSYLADLVGLSETILQARQRELENLKLFDQELRHRINNSLSTMYWQADGLLKDLTTQAADSRAVAKVNVIQKHLKLVTGVLKELSDVTKEVTIDKQACRLDELAVQVLDETQNAFDEARVTVGFGMLDRVSVTADREKLEYSIKCLLENAIEAVMQGRPWEPGGPERATTKELDDPLGADGAPPAGFNVTISIEATNEWGEIRVSDEGIGFDAEIEARLFAPLFTTKTNRTPTAKNTGMGLFTVKRYLEKMGGQILPRSEGARKGAEFTIRLPLTPAGG
jgi:signal transduction histidine kinase/ActR/RegA family two-component response regulator